MNSYCRVSKSAKNHGMMSQNMTKNREEHRTVGRPKKEISHLRFRELYSAWENGKVSQKDICAELQISRATLSRIIAEYRQGKDVEQKLREDVLKDPNTYNFNGENVSDGLTLLKCIKNDKIATVFFDPQYRHVLDYLRYGNEGSGRQKQRSHLPQMTNEQISAMIFEISRVIKPSGYLFLWVDKYLITDGLTIADWITNTPLRKVDMIIWDKGKIGSGARSRYRTEYLLIIQKEPLLARETWVDHGLPDIWPEKVVRKSHPHQKPIELLKRLIIATTTPGDVICDPAAGSYTTLSATASAGDRIFIGCDLIPPNKYKEDKY